MTIVTIQVFILPIILFFGFLLGWVAKTCTQKKEAKK